jgi:hypothetical protein
MYKMQIASRSKFKISLTKEKVAMMSLMSVPTMLKSYLEMLRHSPKRLQESRPR